MAVAPNAPVPANRSTPGSASPATNRASGAGDRALVRVVGVGVMAAHRHRHGLVGRTGPLGDIEDAKCRTGSEWRGATTIWW